MSKITLIDAGSTVLQLARRNRLNLLPLSIFTNCVTLAQLLMDLDELKITLLGGRLRPKNASTVGSLVEAVLDRLRFEQLFMGAGAIAEDNYVHTQDVEEARPNEKMLSCATKVILLMDPSKFDQRSTYKVPRLNDEMDVITDMNLPESWTLKLQETSCRVQHVAKKDEYYPGHSG